MRGLKCFPKIFLYVGRVDFRKSIDGLCEVVEIAMHENPFAEEALFVFVSRCKSRMKILYWDRTGFALWMKRLEKEKFCWPKGLGKSEEVTTMSLSQSQLELLLDGIDIFKIKPHEVLSFSCIT